MMPELFMADAMGGRRKAADPRAHRRIGRRVDRGGCRQPGELVGTAGRWQSRGEKQSESNAMWALSIPVPFTKPVGAGAGGYFALHTAPTSGAPGHPRTSGRWSR